MNFKLTNHHRKYLGLEPIADSWESMQLNDQITLYFDGDTIRKKIILSDTSYHECQLDIKTRNREIVLPKTARGKEKKLNYTSIQAQNPFGVYFSFNADSYVTIANYTTQTTFYDTHFENITIADFKQLQIWLDKFIEDSTAEDLQAIDAFRTAERKRVTV